MTNDELENGIYGLVVSLCQEKAKTIPIEQAKEEVATWLVSVAATLHLNQGETSERRSPQ